MAAESPVEHSAAPAAETSGGRPRLWLFGAFALAIVVATLAAVMVRGNSAAEAAAAEAIKKTNALAVPDESGRIVSVNLATVETPEALADAVAQLPALSHVVALNGGRTAIKDEHLEAIGRMAALESLDLTETGITDEGVKHLRSLGDIKTLVLTGTKITDASVDVIGGLSSLRSVDVSSTQVSNNLAPLADLPALEWILIRDLTLTDEALQQLKECQKLSRLTIKGSNYSEAALTELAKALPGVAVD